MNSVRCLNGDQAWRVHFVTDARSFVQGMGVVSPGLTAARQAAISVTRESGLPTSGCLASSAEDRPWLMCFGDPHGRFHHIRHAVRCSRPRAIILLGDICADKPLHEELSDILELTEVWFIHGNHDSDEDRWWSNISTKLLGTPLADRNLSGRVANVAGMRVAGLGGVFYGKVWHPRDGIPSLYDRPQDLTNAEKRGRMVGPDWQARLRSGIFRGVYNDLAAQEADVLVTHEGPSLHVHGCQVLDELATSMKVKVLVHGHHHCNLAYPSSERQAWRGYCVDERSALVVHP